MKFAELLHKVWLGYCSARCNFDGWKEFRLIDFQLITKSPCRYYGKESVKLELFTLRREVGERHQIGAYQCGMEIVVWVEHTHCALDGLRFRDHAIGTEFKLQCIDYEVLHIDFVENSHDTWHGLQPLLELLAELIE